MTLQAWEHDWLDWAWPIVRIAVDDPEHLSWCRERLAAAEYEHDETADPASDPTLRWPGYVGVDWEPGRGVLFVGSVHSDFTRDGRRAGPPERYAIVAGMASANRGWRQSTRDTARDTRYLESTREAYASLIPGWSRDSAFGDVRRHLGDSVESIAWTNLAHCRARPRTISEYALQLRCSSRDGDYPIGGLIAAIRPVAVVTSVLPIETTYTRRYDLSPGGGYREPWVCAFNGATGQRHGRPAGEWAIDAAATIRRLRGD